MFKIEFKPAEKTIISWKKIIIPCILIFGILGFLLFEGMIRKSMMDSTIEAYKVEIIHHHNDGRKNSNHYTPTYYYIIDDVAYRYTPVLQSKDPKSAMEDITLYYDSSNPNNVVAEYETKLYFGDYLIIIFIVLFIVIASKKVIIR